MEGGRERERGREGRREGGGRDRGREMMDAGHGQKERGERKASQGKTECK